MEDLAFYQQEETMKFAETLDEGEKIGFNILVSVRNGEMTPVEAFKKIEEFASDMVEAETLV
jgi:hypothetical protein